MADRDGGVEDHPSKTSLRTEVQTEIRRFCKQLDGIC